MWLCLEFITYKSLPRLGHLVLHEDEVQVVVDATAKVALLVAYCNKSCKS